MDLAPFVAFAPAVMGWAGQWLKSRKGFPTPAAQAILLALGFGFYAAGHHYAATDTQWLYNGVMWSFALPGMSSVLGSFKVAPPTSN